MAYVIPLSDLMRRVGLLDSLAGLTLAEAAATAPLAVYARCPSGRIFSRDRGVGATRGASVWTLLRTVVLPGAAPIVAATSHRPLRPRLEHALATAGAHGHSRADPAGRLTDFFTLERQLEWPTAAAR
jgi:ABC-type maltose transport system permease subunit